jgi:predicted DNA-binding transcriptional regulator AlpA
MKKLNIREASQQFNLSRARLYKLLEMGKIVGHRSEKRGRGAESWVDSNSIEKHLNLSSQNQKQGRPKIAGDGNYVPVREAAKKTGYCTPHIYTLANRGSVGTKKTANGNWLIHLKDLERFKNSKKT